MKNIKEITEITYELIEYYKNNLNEAQKAYSELTTNTRGLDKSKLEGYYEKHHIIPRCMGGLDEDSNYVLLTYSEHILAHMLLFILNPTVFKLKIAFCLLSNLDIHNKDLSIKIDLTLLENLKSESQKLLWDDQKSREKMINSIRSSHSTNDFKETMSKVIKELWNDPVRRLVYKDSAKKRWLNPEYKAKFSKKVLGPDGTIYQSGREAARILGIPKSTFQEWITKFPEKGFKYLN